MGSENKTSNITPAEGHPNFTSALLVQNGARQLQSGFRAKLRRKTSILSASLLWPLRYSVNVLGHKKRNGWSPFPNYSVSLI